MLALFSAPAVATAAGSSGDDAVSRVTQHVKDFKDLFLAVFVATLAFLALTLVPYVVIRMIRLSRAGQLVLADAIAGLDDAAGKNALPGISVLARQQLRRDLASAGDQVKKTIDRASLLSAPFVVEPLAPRAAPDETLHQLTDSLSELAGEHGGTAVTFLGQALLKPTGTKVTPTLLKRGDAPGIVGVTFEISALDGSDAPEYVTLWEHGDPNALKRLKRPARCLPAAAPDQKKPASQDTRVTDNRGALRAIAGALRSAYRLNQAVGYLQEELGSVPNDYALAEELASLQAVLQVQAGARAAYDAAIALEAAGAVESFVNTVATILPLDNQERGSALWAATINGDPETRAQALVSLGDLYGSSTFLDEEARELYKRAVGLGSVAARRTLGAFNAAIATSLIEAASKLHAIGRSAEARKFANEALALVPGNEGAKRILALVNKVIGSPPVDTDTKAAAAHVALAKLFEKRRDLAAASEEYRRALESTPTDEAVQNQLSHALSRAKSLQDRLLEVLVPATRLLTWTLLRRELLRDQQRQVLSRISPVKILAEGTQRARQRRTWLNEARVRNYIGMLLQANGMPGYKIEFLCRAIEEFSHASELDPNDYRPQENWAVTQIILAETLAEESNQPPREVAEARDLLHDASEHFEQAKVLIDSTSGLSEEAIRTARRPVLVEQTLAAYLSGRSGSIAQTAAWIEDATRCWVAVEERNTPLLYNLAAVTSRKIEWVQHEHSSTRPNVKFVPSPELEIERQLGRRRLVHAMFRDVWTEWWSLACADMDLAELRADWNFGAALDVLREARRTNRCLPAESDRAKVEKVVNDAMQAGET
jgi:tetratricopeptide (TPR) repeat protein